MSPVPVPPEKRFWPKVDRSGGPEACWPWLGARRGRTDNGDRYDANTYIRPDGKGRDCRACRAATARRFKNQEHQMHAAHEVDPDLLSRAVELVLSTQFATLRHLQHRLAIGQTTAQVLMIRMAEEGVVGPAKHGRSREVLARADQADEVVASMGLGDAR